MRLVADAALQEIKEFVEILQDSARFEKLGAKIPRGALVTLVRTLRACLLTQILSWSGRLATAKHWF